LLPDSTFFSTLLGLPVTVFDAAAVVDFASGFAVVAVVAVVAVAGLAEVVVAAVAGLAEVVIAAVFVADYGVASAIRHDVGIARRARAAGGLSRFNPPCTLRG
jgi:hypothetical protein